MLALAQWLEHTSVSQEIQKALWLIPLLQTIHIIAIAMVLSSVLMIELRILGVWQVAQHDANVRPLRAMALDGPRLARRDRLGVDRRRAQARVAQPCVPDQDAHARGHPRSGARLSNIAAKEPAFWEGHSLGRRLTGGFAVIVFFLWCAIAVAGRWIAYVHTT